MTTLRIPQLVTAAALLLMVGCAQYVDLPPATAVQLQTPACTGNDPPDPARVPLDFAPVEALVCGEMGKGGPRDNPGDQYLETRYRGEFTVAVEALTGRDRKKQTCDYSLVAMPELWLIDASGGGLIPRYPLDECGGPTLDALKAILELPVSHKEQRVALPAPLATSPTLTFPIPSPGDANPPPSSPSQPR
ncbi:hypothetical protein [Williamsia soli]|uniref:hypothetical protein n=1 Tax=Williamsia soli TaxID=364929 RepID=UPI001A9FFEDE|nr:hypothetical protein [Williamsia soli]